MNCWFTGAGESPMASLTFLAVSWVLPGDPGVAEPSITYRSGLGRACSHSGDTVPAGAKHSGTPEA